MSAIEEMISLTDALEIIEHQLALAAIPVQTVPVRQALGRIAVENQIARLDLPPFDKSAMDGYAVGPDELDEYNVIEIVPAGCVPHKDLSAGTAIKVMTGAPVPIGSEKVIMIEHTCLTNGKIHVLSHSKATNICRKAEDVRTSDTILHAPAMLGPLEIANLIAVGITEVKVAMPVRIAILATGNEIVDSPDKLDAGKIMNSNSPMLEALCRKYSLDITETAIVTDDRNTVASAIRRALNNADIVVLSGGVSAGDFDFVIDAMKQAGLQIHFDRLAVKPGKPMTFASADNKLAFGLPGNPVAVFLMFHLFVLYAAGLLAGMKRKPRYVSLPLDDDFHRRRADRMAFLPCRLTQNEMLKPVEYHGTAHLSALLDADGFFVIPKGVTNVAAGKKVSYLCIKDCFQ
ncbi:MAG: molybdopterin molybdotransferase MoeA [Anaerohalosphaera sp.]|nr:molybdopterin molybdotransferase MoeA [Anaerohalosphaera sp.]